MKTVFLYRRVLVFRFQRVVSSILTPFRRQMSYFFFHRILDSPIFFYFFLI